VYFSFFFSVFFLPAALVVRGPQIGQGSNFNENVLAQPNTGRNYIFKKKIPLFNRNFTENKRYLMF